MKKILPVLALASICAMPSLAHADWYGGFRTGGGSNHYRDYGRHNGHYDHRQVNRFDYVVVNPSGPPRYYYPSGAFVPQTQVTYIEQQPMFYSSSTGGYCREFTRSIKVGGRLQQGYGTACQQPDGSWLIAN